MVQATGAYCVSVCEWEAFGAPLHKYSTFTILPVHRNAAPSDVSQTENEQLFGIFSGTPAVLEFICKGQELWSKADCFLE